MDDLMNKVSALIESHVKSEVDERSTSLKVAYKVIEDARRELNAVPGEGLLAAAMRTSRERDSLRGSVCGQTSKDEIRRGARALGFWEKLVETLCIGPADEETFDHVMECIQAMKEWRLHAEDCQKQIEVLCERIDAVRKDRDAANGTASKYRTMWEQLHRAQGEEIGAAGQLKELLSALGLAHFDRNTIEGALKATRERDARLVAERDDAVASVQSWREKAQALEAKLLEVRKVADLTVIHAAP